MLYVRNVLDQFELKLIQILLRPEKKMYSCMAIGRNDNYLQRTFTADAFRKRRKRENSTVGPGSSSPREASVIVGELRWCGLQQIFERRRSYNSYPWSLS